MIINLVSASILTVRHEDREIGALKCTFEELHNFPCSCVSHHIRFYELIRFH
jgi:hypothetical protein